MRMQLSGPNSENGEGTPRSPVTRSAPRGVLKRDPDPNGTPQRPVTRSVLKRDPDPGPPSPRDRRFEAYLQDLYARGIAAGVHKARYDRPFVERLEREFVLALDGLAKARDTLRLIDLKGDPYETFKARAIASMLGDIASGVRKQSDMLEHLGFGRVLDSDFSKIATQMRPEHLPAAEAEILRTLGFPEIADNLPGLFDPVSQHASASAVRRQEVPITEELVRLAELLEEARKAHLRLAEIDAKVAVLTLNNGSEGPERQESIENLEREQAEIKKPRRWWKGVGKVAQGVVMSLADVALAVGALPFEVSEETRSWGCIVSVTVGVGTMMDGIGDLRAE
jgi:hypothetical protein